MRNSRLPWSVRGAALSGNLHTAALVIAVPVVFAMLLGLFTPLSPIIMVAANLFAVAMIVTVIGAVIGVVILL